MKREKKESTRTKGRREEGGIGKKIRNRRNSRKTGIKKAEGKERGKSKSKKRGRMERKIRNRRKISRKRRIE